MTSRTLRDIDQPITAEVDYGSATSRGRHPDRAWLVRLRRADRSVIVAWGLSHTAADHLAHNIAQLLDPPSTPRSPGHPDTPD